MEESGACSRFVFPVSFTWLRRRGTDVISLAPFVAGKRGQLGPGAVCRGVWKDTVISVGVIFLRTECRHHFIVQSAVREAEGGAMGLEEFVAYVGDEVGACRGFLPVRTAGYHRETAAVLVINVLSSTTENIKRSQ